MEACGVVVVVVEVLEEVEGEELPDEDADVVVLEEEVEDEVEEELVEELEVEDRPAAEVT